MAVISCQTWMEAPHSQTFSTVLSVICLWFLQEIYFGVRAKTLTSTPVLWSAHLTPAGHGNWHHVCPNPTRYRIEEGRHWHGCPARCKLPAFSADTQLMQLTRGWGHRKLYIPESSQRTKCLLQSRNWNERATVWNLKLEIMEVGCREKENWTLEGIHGSISGPCNRDNPGSLNMRLMFAPKLGTCKINLYIIFLHKRSVSFI